MIRALTRASLLLAVLVGVSACGNKGPLVLPDQADKTKQGHEKDAAAKPAPGKDAAPEPAEPHR